MAHHAVDFRPSWPRRDNAVAVEQVIFRRAIDFIDGDAFAQ
jgi:hypothetical protein